MKKGVVPSLAVLAVLLAVVIVVFHNAAVRFALSQLAAPATGYRIDTTDVRLGSQHGALIGVRISRGGEPVLRAARIDLYYSPRDLLPGSKHRFGLRAITIDRPQLTIVHHENGTYNIAIPKAVSGPRAPQRKNPVPIDVSIRVRNASATLIDQYRFYQASRVQRVDGIDAQGRIDTGGATTYLVTGRLQDGGKQPFRIAGTIDYRSGYAVHHVTVRAIPIATVANYFINSPAAHVLSGTVRGMDLRAWSFGSSGYHLAGSGLLDGGGIVVRALESPIRHLHGPIAIFDSGFASSRLTATVGHLSIVCAGGIFDFRSPQFRLGVEGRGDLRNLKDVLKVASGLPIFGGVRIHALIEGAIAEPLLLIGFDGRRFNYGAVPIDEPRGAVALYRSNLIVLPFHATYSGIALHVHGNLQLGTRVHSVLALHAVGPSSRLPYLGALVSDQPVVTEVLIHGTDLKIDSRGFLASLDGARSVSGFFDLNRYGVGTFGPIAVTTPQGGSLVAGFALDRLHGNSAFWVSARDIRLNQPAPVVLAGTNIPQLPPIDAHIDEADMAGTGSARNVVVGGTAYLSPATIAGVPFDTIAARFAGPFAASELSSVHADGPWGSFDGGGTFAPNLIAARGNYAGTLQGLHMFLGNFPAKGGIRGPMAIAIAQGKIFVQAQNAQLTSASIHGIPISAISGTMSFDKNVLRVYSARANAAGGSVVAAGTFATGPTKAKTRLALATTQLHAAALAGFGVPIAAGALRAVAAIEPGTAIPNLDAGVVLTGGAAAGFAPFDATADVSIARDAMHVSNAIASLGSTYAHVDGGIGNLAAGTPSYDVTAQVPVGDIASMLRLAHRPAYNAGGSFEGQSAYYRRRNISASARHGGRSGRSNQRFGLSRGDRADRSEPQQRHRAQRAGHDRQHSQTRFPQRFRKPG